MWRDIFNMDQRYLKSVLKYSCDTGLFKWQIVTNSRIHIGMVAGTKNHPSGYVYIFIDKIKYLAHRLAWLYVHGEFPQNCIDHINGVKSDNRIINLRDATRMENSCNRGKNKNNTSGFKGVSFYKNSKKYHAEIRGNGKRKRLGCFTCPKAAHEAYRKAAKEMHQNFKNFG